MLKNLCLVILSLLITVLIMEFGVRVFSYTAFPKMMEIDSQLGWRHAANREKVFVNEDGEQIRVVQNRFGHRGPELTAGMKAGARRILFLGDSFTEAVQVNENELFTARLDQADSRFEVINAGVGGWGTVQQYLYLENEGIGFKPDIVVQMFYSNDLSDNCQSYSPGIGVRPYAYLGKDSVVRIERELQDRDFRNFALPVPFLLQVNRYSYLYSFLNTRIYQRIFDQKLQELARADLKRVNECGLYEIFFGVVDKVRKMLLENEIDFKLVLIPAAHEIESGESETHERIIDYCVRTGLDCLSLLPALSDGLSRGLRPYFVTDIHWTRDGHEIVAEAVKKFLSSDIDSF
jgi:hypothetical protein